MNMDSPPAWAHKGVCAQLVAAGADPDAWIETRHPDADNALAACTNCIVKAKCWEAGKGFPGIWGGVRMTDNDWRAIRRRDKKGAAA